MSRCLFHQIDLIALKSFFLDPQISLVLFSDCRLKRSRLRSRQELGARRRQLAHSETFCGAVTKDLTHLSPKLKNRA